LVIVRSIVPAPHLKRLIPEAKARCPGECIHPVGTEETDVAQLRELLSPELRPIWPQHILLVPLQQSPSPQTGSQQRRSSTPKWFFRSKAALGKQSAKLLIEILMRQLRKSAGSSQEQAE
jgi:hypothetical protein